MVTIIFSLGNFIKHEVLFVNLEKISLKKHIEGFVGSFVFRIELKNFSYDQIVCLIISEYLSNFMDLKAIYI